MAKVAIAVEQALAERRRTGGPGRIAPRVLARGDGWSVADVVCTADSRDRPFEERQSNFTIAMVVAGSFEYRSTPGRALMTPGSLMLGNPGQCFECGHEHGAGDRCVAFSYDPAYFDRLAADARVGADTAPFTALRVPPVRGLSRLVAGACAGLSGAAAPSWEELGVDLAIRTLELLDGHPPAALHDSPDALARVTRAVRTIEGHPDGEHRLASLAREAGLSVYHFLRLFEQLTGVTPHQFVLRARLREAAVHLALDRKRILDVALDCGFGDVSNFNRAFRAEFGMSPRRYRSAAVPA